MIYLGDFPTSAIVSFLWNTTAIAGESITRATDGTLKIFKTNSNTTTWATERSSLNGVTQVEDFDTTGIHAVRIDLSDNTDAGFYAAGNEYQVAIVGAVIDGKTINAYLASFSIERANGVLALLKGNAVKVDVNTIKTQAVAISGAGTVTFPNSTIGTSTYAGTDTSGTTTLLTRVVGTLAAGTHNPQSGDTYALANGVNGFVNIKSDTAAILVDTAEIGVAGAGLTAVISTETHGLDM